ncbi:hypothetical protein KIN20_033999 [Parelaphostrongylus tenuis]|uniref:Uncharacterized protein n=1 Tax=Parelaphostrongylus tenuis TaxID=148309 RepID=A0AAD5R9N5_PARTN|nr:hypothetical protein KIN20_033999 [Parelaphostrongylus tenuis]
METISDKLLQQAQKFVLQVFDVLERQARSALLPDAVISAILDQFTVQIQYNPMNCPLVTGPEEDRESSALSNPFKSAQAEVQQASKLKMFTIPKEELTLLDKLDNFCRNFQSVQKTIVVALKFQIRAIFQTS